MDIYDTELQEELKIKIIVVGDRGVGKSNIRNRFCRNKFQPFSVKTVGVEFSNRRFVAPLEMRPSRITASIWDVAGETSSLVAGFFKNACGVIYVCDLTNELSLEGLKAWKESVNQNINVSRPVEMLLANKKDLLNLREVGAKQYEKVAKQLQINLCFETSALEGENIEKAFQEFLKVIAMNFEKGVKIPTQTRKTVTHHTTCC